jgi:hypothetical protein
MKSFCHFCGSLLKGKRSREHVFPQWLLNHLEISKNMISPTHFSNDGQVLSERIHNLDNLLAGRVCRECNNGWMSKLELVAKENIIALAENQKVVIDLDANERFILARWAFKTALVLNLASNYHKNIPKIHYRWIYNHSESLPKQVIVFAQQHYHTEPFFWIQSPSWFIKDKLNVINKTMVKSLGKKSYKIALLFKNLLLLIAYQPFSELLYVISRGIHIPMYPQRGPMQYYEMDDFEWNDSIESIIQFHGSLGLGTKSEDALK